MKKNEGKANSGGIGFVGLLTIAFIVLRLCKVIDWAWIWVLSPLWLSFTFGIIVLALYLIITISKKKDKCK